MNHPLANLYGRAKQTLSTTGIALWIYLLVQLCVSLVLGLGLGSGVALFPELTFSYFDMMNFFNAIALLVVTPLSGGLATWFVSDSLRLSYRKQWSLRFRKRDIVHGFCVLLLCSFVSGLLINGLSLLLPAPIEQPDFGYSANALSNALLFVSVALVGPVVEEVFFRGTILRATAPYGRLFALGFSSLCFAMMHLNIAQGVPAFFMGFVLGWFYLKSNSLVVPVAIHVLNNTLAFLAMDESLAWIASIVILLAACYGVVYLALHARQIGAELDEAQGDPHFLTLVCMNPWLIAFFIVFVLASLGTLVAL